ncbi:MAG: ABC-F family ATP-binding cassette domain-containing protein, partial [Bacteroidales bacterium]|nr:ABC-F family ATP-binding cassette domain-containing protein [Bacteroidales bacterium]
MSSLLQANGITKRYGDKLLFENINFYVDVGDKIAIVGLNGSGKTSLLRILSGEESSNAGSISLKRDLKIAVLEQDFKLNPDNTVLEAVLHDSGDLYACISNYENALNSGDTEQIQTSIEQMDALQAWDYEAKMKQILGKLKIDEFDKKISVLSGGQKKRVALAAVLIQDFDLLILDEPTNHLDLDMIEWLEEYLDNEVKSLVTITHDRYFLDRVCNRIAEIDDKTMYFYEGNYSKFVELKNLREEIHAASVEKAKNLLSTEIDWLRRMPKARTTKSKYRIKAAEELSEKARTQKNDASFEIKVQASRLGSKIVNLKNISKSFGEKKVIDEFSYIFAPHEKIGIVGNNGTGKTTLLKLITQQLNPDKGKISIGETVKFAYYKQDGLNFDKNDRPID